MGLSNAAHDVVDTRPDEVLATLVDGSQAADAFVVGVDDPVEALDLVTEIRAVHDGAPVLLVAGRAPGWSALAGHHLDAVEVVPLPVTRPALLDALQRLLTRTPQPAIPPAETLPEISAEVVEQEAVPDGLKEPPPDVLSESEAPPLFDTPTVDVTEVDDSADVESPSDEEVDPQAALDPDSAVATSEYATDDGAQEPELTTNVEVTVETVDTTPESSVPPSPLPYGDVANARISSHPHHSAALDLAELRATVMDDAPPRRQRMRLRPAAHAGSPIGESQQPSRPSTSQGSRPPEEASPAALVRQLLLAVDGVANLSEVATLVVSEAVGRTGASAGALLLPDDSVWRVAGGTSLRSLELRCQQAAESWLVETVAHGDRGVIVEDTDIARQRLHGAPLANRHQLLAAPVPDVDGVLLVARDDAPFTEAELAALASVGREAAQPLVEALEARQLARSLEHLRNLAE
jgi:hypothetical protein